jgi:hypothetical protein
MPSKKRESSKKSEPHRKKLAAKQKDVQPVLHTVRGGSFVHCYLACGHMITLRKGDLKEPSLSSMECWACEEENKERSPSQ